MSRVAGYRASIFALLTPGRSEAPRPENAISESGYASQAPGSVINDDQAYQDLNSPMDMSRQGSHQGGSMALFGLDQGQFDPLAGIGQGHLADPFNGTRDSTSRPHGSTLGHNASGLSLLSDAALQVPSPTDALMVSPGTHRGSVPSLRVSQFGFDGQAPQFKPVGWGGPPPVPQRYSWTSRPSSLIDNQDNLTSNRTDSGEYACSHCEKVKKRECDLR